MLVLSRKVGEEIVIGDDVKLRVLSVNGNQVKLGFDAPRSVSIHRQETGQPGSPQACRTLPLKTPRRRNEARSHPNQGGIWPAGGSLATLTLKILSLARISRRASSGGGLSRLSMAMASPPCSCRPTVICAMFTPCLPKMVPMKPIRPRRVAVGEEQGHAVEVGVEPMPVQLHQAQELVAEERARRRHRALARVQFHAEQGGEIALLRRLLLHDVDAALAGQQGRVDDVHVVEMALQQAGREGRGDQARGAPRHLAAIEKLGLVRRGRRELGQQQTQPPGQIDVEPQLVHLGPVHGRHVDREADHRRASGSR